MRKIVPVLSMVMLLLATALPAEAGVVRVERGAGGGWVWLVDGAPFAVRGAAHVDDAAALASLAAAGATVVRTYGTEAAWVLDAAHGLGLKVIQGLDMVPARLGFNYADPAAVAAQEAAMVAFVRAHKDHPALLAWGIGNEVELPSESVRPDRAVVWAAIDRAARAVKAADPDHPTVMAVTDRGAEDFAATDACCAHIDVIGVSIYGEGLFDLPRRMAPGGMTKPVLLAEVGPLGQWQAGRTPWGAPGEPTSTGKAAWFARAWPFLEAQPAFAGGLAFLWGAKQEATRTWHGLLLADGTPTEAADALAVAWGGAAFLGNRAPTIRGIGMNTATVAPGGALSAGVDAHDPDGDSLRVDWAVVAEATGPSLGGLPEPPPEEVPTAFAPAPEGVGVVFAAPDRPGAYRLFITVRDRAKAATANLPFLVE